jgi:hypothetical protein
MAPKNMMYSTRRGPFVGLVLLCLIIGPAALATATAN